MEKLKVGICGAGNSATNAHPPGYQKIDEIEVVAICDIVIDRAKAAAEKYNIQGYFSSVEEMLEKVDLDIVDVCTWNDGHAPCTIAAARAGKHVVCEKPMSTSLSEAKRMLEEVEKAGVKFMLAVPNRWNPANMALREMYDNGEFGEVYLWRCTSVYWRLLP